MGTGASVAFVSKAIEPMSEKELKATLATLKKEDADKLRTALQKAHGGNEKDEQGVSPGKDAIDWTKEAIAASFHPMEGAIERQVKLTIMFGLGGEELTKISVQAASLGSEVKAATAPCLSEGLALRSLVLADGSILADDASIEQQEINSGTALVAYVVDKQMFVGTYKYEEEENCSTLRQELTLREDGSGEFSSDAIRCEDDGGDSTYVRKGTWTFTEQLITLVCDQVEVTLEYSDDYTKEENWTATFNVNHQGNACTLETRDSPGTSLKKAPRTFTKRSP